MRLLCAVGLVALLFAGVAQADVIFDNFGPGNSYQAGSGWTVSGAASPTGAAYVEGMSFTPTGSYTLNALDVAVGWAVSTADNSLNLALYDDAGGLPGSIPLESWSGLVVPDFAGNNSPISVSSLVHPVLSNGTPYWLVASVGTDTQWDAWNLNSVGDLGPIVYSLNGGPWSPHTDARGAFRVTGTSAGVPEPCTCALFGLGALGLRLRRKGKAA